MELILHILHPPGNTKPLRLERTSVIGRAADCQVRLALPEISRKHCQLTFKNGQVLLRDLGSSNGTRLNGKPIAPGVDHVVGPGVVIELGPLSCRVEIRGLGEDEPGTLTGGHEETKQADWPSSGSRYDEKTAVRQIDQDPAFREVSADSGQSSIELPAVDLLAEEFASPSSKPAASTANPEDPALHDFLKKMSQ